LHVSIFNGVQCIAIRASNGFAKIGDRIAEGPQGGRVTTNCTAALANVCYFRFRKKMFKQKETKILTQPISDAMQRRCGS
jgi:hypothetical protein